MELSGKHAVVTGAAGGIGEALAERFHTEGASVVLSDVQAGPVQAVAARLDSLRPGSAIAVVTDIGTEAGNRHLVAAAEAEFGPIDLFFANAGVGIGRDPMSPEASGSRRSTSTSTRTAGQRGICCPAGWLEARATSAPPRPWQVC